MANIFLNAVEYANTMLLLVKNHLVMGRLVDGKFRDQVTDQNGLKIFVKRPPRFVQTSGATLQPQDIVTGSTSMTVDQYKNVHVSLGDLEYVQSFNDLMQNQTMLSAASTLAHGVENFLQGLLTQFPSWVNAPGATAVDSPLATPQQFIPVRSRLENLSAPSSDRNAVFSTEDAGGVMGSLIDKFMSGTALDALKNAQIPMLSGIANYETQGTVALVTGTRPVATYQVNGAAQNVNYRTVKDTMTQTFNVKTLTAAQTISAGEVFTIPAVFAVNQRTQKTLSYLQQFTVVTAFVAAGATGTITISPPIIVPGTNDGVSTTVNTAFATVSAAPADSALITFAGNPSSAFNQRAAWHKSAIQLVTARLHMPETGVASFAQDPETGIAIRYWRGSDIATGIHAHRWDMIYGATVVDPMLGTRFSGF